MAQSVLISTILRISDPRYIWQLEEALFSLSNMSGLSGPREAIVVTQGLHDAARLSLRSLVGHLQTSEFSIKIIHSEFDAGVDRREILLNIGVKKAVGRYISFLDYDDLIYPNAFLDLIAEGRKTGAPIVFGRIRVSKVERLEKFCYLYKYDYPFEKERSLFQLWHDNFCPIHSFLIDTFVVKKSKLFFEPGLRRAEDYALLLKITAEYGAAFTDRLVGEYQYREDGSNTVQSGQENSGDKNVEWAQAKERIDAIKSALRPNISLLDIERQINSFNVALREVDRLKESIKHIREYRKVTEEIALKNKLLSSYLRMLGGVSALYDRASTEKMIPRYSIDDVVSIDRNFKAGIQLRVWATPTKYDQDYGDYWMVFKCLVEGKSKVSFSVPSLERPDVAEHFSLRRLKVAAVVDFVGVLDVSSLEVFLINEAGVLIKAERY